MEIDIRKTVTDAAYITVGVGVLGYQQAQVRRRELSKAIGSSVDDVSRTVGSSVDELRSRIDPVLEHLQRLPDQVREAAEAGRDRISYFVESRWPLSTAN